MKTFASKIKKMTSFFLQKFTHLWNICSFSINEIGFFCFKIFILIFYMHFCRICITICYNEIKTTNIPQEIFCLSKYNDQWSAFVFLPALARALALHFSNHRPRPRPRPPILKMSPAPSPSPAKNFRNLTSITVSILERESNNKKRLILEANHIKNQQPQLNGKEEQEQILKLLMPLKKNLQPQQETEKFFSLFKNFFV